MSSRHETEAAQREHYERISRDYEAHYFDSWSERYRERFINAPMLDAVDLRGRRVLEAMCASGSTTAYLLKRGALVTGLDISPRQIESFNRRWPGASSIQSSILATGLPPESFDCVVIVGGLHHVQPHVQDAIDEVRRVLVPGGMFCFAEPHSDSALDLLRRRWYSVDPLFEQGERSLDISTLESRNAAQFEVVTRRYLGNLAYLLVFNSLVFRVPSWLKDLYARPLLGLEPLLGRIQGRRTACFVVSRWRKRV